MEWTDRELRTIEEEAGTTEEQTRRKHHRPPARARWDRKNLVTLTTKVRRRDAEELRAYCRISSITPYRLLQRSIKEWLKQQRRLWN